MAANPQYAEGEVIANKYVVEGLIGESPASRTYLANGNAGKLCVKSYRQEVSARLLSAPDFFLKAGIMTEIEHDNLCGCIDVQEEMGQVFVARAHTEGESFEEWARKHRGDGNYYSRGLELLWQTCQGLTALHERTRHLNIHPGNVIVGPLVAKLCDWDPRALGNTEMTPDPLPVRPEYQGYRAPEAAGRGGFLSYPSTDLFAVAGLLYRLIKGEHPSGNPSQTLAEVRSMDKDVSVFLGKALHPRPEERFQDAGAFSDALWELQGAMQRLQERAVRSSSSAVRGNPEPAARREEPMFPDPPAHHRPSEPDFSAMPQSAASGQSKTEGDSFFDFFPSADAAPDGGSPTKPQNPGIPGHKNQGQAAEPKSSGDTLFGAPAFVSPRQETPKPFQDPPAYIPPRPAPPRAEPKYAPPPSGLSELETPGTLFGSSAPLFSTPSKPAPRSEPLEPAKPLAVSLSSLEKDPLELAGNEPGGFTAYGFKGAGDNRTGIYTPEAKAAEAKTKLMILLGTVGAVILVVGLVGLFLYLRSHAAHKDEVAGTQAVGESLEPQADPEALHPAAVPEPAATEKAPPPRHDAAPYPEVASETRNTPEPAAPATTANNGYSEPPMPIEPARPGAQTERAEKGATPAVQPKMPAAAKAPVYKGNNHVTPEREAALMGMVQTRTWPNTAAERLKAADDLNDLGKTAEANVAYSKVLVAGDVVDKQKVSAFGGLAVTFQAMGMKDQARDAVQQILEINPRNGFALKLKEKLK
ncbi:MAG: uncharacterized protein JWP91_4402 [Fibrobacteres bacterium]|nr:uncharacterized protein [Fibrobacterota bacterium]